MHKAAVVCACLLLFFLSAFANMANNIPVVVILTIALLLGFPEARRSSLASVIILSGIATFAMPLLGLLHVGEADVQTAWYALFIIVAIILVAYSEPRPVPAPPPGHGAIDLPLIGIYLVVGLWMGGSEGLRQVSFYAGWAAALVHLERLHSRTNSLLVRSAGLFMFAAVIGYFVIFVWEGAGRIVQLSFAFAPILLAVHYRAFPLSGLAIAGAAVALSFAGRLLRFGWSDGLAGLAVDSGASSLTFTSWLWNATDIILARGSILEQWVLLFLNWFPRDLWAAKPLGIGSTFVDMVTGREGVSEDHSYSIGIFGEHLFYLPHAWIVSVAALIGVLIFLRRSIVRLSRPYRAPVIIFDVWLITLFWGGMAAFAARAWFALIPVIPYLLFIKWLDASRRRAAQKLCS